MKTTAKILSVILSVCVLICAFVLIASAGTEDYSATPYQVGDTNYATLAEAFTAATESDETIYLVADATTDDVTYSISKNYTIDLNGHTLTSGRTGYVWFKPNNCTLTITGEGTIVNPEGAGNAAFDGWRNNSAILYKVIGTGKGITINNYSKNGAFITSGHVSAEFENVTINHAPTAGQQFVATSASMTFKNCNINIGGVLKNAFLINNGGSVVNFIDTKVECVATSLYNNTENAIFATYPNTTLNIMGSTITSSLYDTAKTAGVRLFDIGGTVNVYDSVIEQKAYYLAIREYADTSVVNLTNTTILHPNGSKKANNNDHTIGANGSGYTTAIVLEAASKMTAKGCYIETTGAVFHVTGDAVYKSTACAGIEVTVSDSVVLAKDENGEAYIVAGWKSGGNTGSGTFTWNNCTIQSSFRYGGSNAGGGADFTHTLNNCELIIGPYFVDLNICRPGVLIGTQDKFIMNGTKLACRNTYYGGAITINEGSRFDEDPKADPNLGKIAEGCSVYFDPAGCPEYPWVVTATDPEAAAASDYFLFVDFKQNSMTLADGIITPATTTMDENGYVTSAQNSTRVQLPEQVTELGLKHGLVETVEVNGNSFLKYTVLAPTNAPDATEFTASSASNTMDTYMIIGHGYNEGDMKLKDYNKIVIDFDFMAGSEKGYVPTTIYLNARGAGADGKQGNTSVGIAVNADGTLSPNAALTLSATAANATLAKDYYAWNHITVVAVVGATLDQCIATYYVNGIEYGSGVYLSTAGFNEIQRADETDTLSTVIQGVRIQTQITKLTVGSGYAVDNFMFRCYKDLNAEYDDIAATKYYTSKAGSENISVLGKGYATVNDAIIAANKYNETIKDDENATAAAVQLKGNAYNQTVTEDGTVYTNDYSLDYTADSSAIIRTTTSLTFDSTNTETLKVITYLTYEFVETAAKVDEVKLGHKIPAYDAAENFESPVAYANFTGDWDGPVGYVTADMLIEGEQYIYPIYETSLKTNKKLGIKTNLSLYSDFVVNIYVPAALVDGGYVTLTDESFGTYEIGGVTYYAYAKSVNYAGVANATSFDIAIADTEAGVWDDDYTGPLTGERTVDVSVLGYAKAILANEAYAADHALMNAMLNYVYEAAVYFENVDLAEALKDYNAEENNQTYEVVNENNISSVIKSVSVDINADAPAFVITFTDTYTGKVTVTYKNVYGTEKTEVVEANGTEVAIATLRVYNLDATLTITLEGEDGEFTYNLDAYAQYLEGDEAETLVKALYDYIATAKAYKLA